MRVTRVGLAIGAHAALALLAARAWAQPVDHEAAGYQLAADGKLDQALVEFQAAYDATHQPQLLFAMGRIHALRGDCARATDRFQRFLATQPGPKAVDAANAAIASCKPAPVAAPPDPPLDNPTPPPPPPDNPTPPPPPPRAARTSFGAALVHDRFAQVGAAAGVVAGGLLTYGLYLRCWDGVCEDSYADYQAKRRRAPSVAIAAGVTGAVAVAFITTGVVRAMSRPDDEPGFDVAVAPTDGGAAVAFGGSF